MPAKTSDETAWKLAAIDRLIEQQLAHVGTLDAKVIALPADVPEAHREYHVKQLAVARDQLAALKKQKRKPGTLLTLAHLLLDEEGHDRLKAFPKGSENILAVLKDEQRRINQKHFERNTKQRENSTQLRPHDAASDALLAGVVAKVARGNPDGPKDLWPHLEHALADACRAMGGDCEPSEEDDTIGYDYSFEEAVDRKTIIHRGRLTYPEFCKILRTARSASE